MFFYIKGKITYHLKRSIIVECSGLGYEVFVSNVSRYKIGEEMKIFTSLYRREDEEFIIGFKDFSEKEMYLKLVSCKGIGPRLALACLSSASLSSLTDAINKADIRYLRSLPGIGPRVASQIVLDLQGKLIPHNEQNTGDENLDDAVSALKNFGFSNSEIVNAISKINLRNLTTEAYIQKALENLTVSK